MPTSKKYNFELLIILGATATGKTRLAVKIANKLNGEIISADSRQIYKNLNIGTGKDYEEYFIDKKYINYHLIDILDVNKNYSVYEFQKDFKIAYNKINLENKLPILCGGTGLYIESILLDYPLLNSAPNLKLRNNLELKSIDELLIIAGEKFINNSNHSELNNKRRIIRFIEKLKASKNKINQIIRIKTPLIIGVEYSRDRIREKISKRLKMRIKEGLIDEVKALTNNGITYSRLESIGLEYKFVSLYLKNQLNKEELKEKLTIAIQQFAKRQLSWYRRMERRGLKIHWIKEGNENILFNLIKNYEINN